MGESERAGSAQAVPAITRSESRSASVSTESLAGVVTGEILVEPTTKTPPPETADGEVNEDKVANQRGMRPLTRP